MAIPKFAAQAVSGWLDAEATKKPMTKAARKNAKRKEKKQSDEREDDAMQAINDLRQVVCSQALQPISFSRHLLSVRAGLQHDDLQHISTLLWFAVYHKVQMMLTNCQAYSTADSLLACPALLQG